jgi:hypothetical protein
MALLEPINTELAETLWRLVSDGAGVDELLEELSSHGLRSLGSFAMAQYEEGAVRVVVRGICLARVVADGVPRVIGSNGVRTWVEEVVNAPSTVTLQLAGDITPAPTFCSTTGLLPASVLQRGEGVVATPLASVEWAAVDALDSLLPPVAAATIEPTPPPAPIASPQPERYDDPGRTISAAEFFERSGDLAPAETVDEPMSTEPEPSAIPPLTSEPEQLEPNEFDDLYGRTIARSVQSAAVHVAEAEAPEPEPTTDRPALQPSTYQPAPDIPVIGGVPSLIQGIPGTSAPDMGDHDGRTMTKAQLAAMRAVREGGAAPTPQAAAITGPSVQALLCPSQHPNPPQLTACRKCFAPLTGSPVVVARPVLAVLRFQDGTTVSLDRPALIGRNPKVEGAIPNEMPTLHRLDVGQGLSRTHASIRLEGWQVLLDDLNSANGTVVTLPGREPRRLHPGEPVLLEIGSSIDFGGEVVCTVEAG